MNMSASVQAYISALVAEHKYRSLPMELSEECRAFYLSSLPEWCAVDGVEADLFSKQGVLISTGYNRVVIGDYGPFIEFEKAHVVRSNIRCQPGQKYRYRDPKFKDKVKYFWYTAKEESGVKIYFQQRTVSYADYKVGSFYVSPFEVEPK